MTNHTFSLFITLIIFITKLNAGIIYVSATGSDEDGDGSMSNPFETIQKGVDVAIEMDTVYVSNGIYEGGIVISNKTISLIGESREETKINQPIPSPQISIIDCQADTTRVENFIIKRGSSNNGGGIYSSGSTIKIDNVDFEYNSSSNNGAAINSIESTVKVQNSTFNSNTCDNLGGAIYVDPLTTCEIYNSSFTNNGAWNGGAIATVGGGRLRIQGSNISYNNAAGYNPNPDQDYPTYGGGGGIYQEWSDSLEIYDSEISNNTAVNAPGGGIAIYLSNDIIIDNIILNNNSSSGGGGGVMFLRTDNVIFENSTIANNISQENSGGGIFIGSESGLESIVINATFNRLSIFNNHAMSGGAIFCWSTILNLYNSTLAQNEATNSEWSGGGLASHYVTEPNIINSLFYDNIPNSIHNGYPQTSVLVAYSLVQEVWAGEGNLVDIDPLFMDPENEDFRLQLASPCIDAGTADLDGNGFDDNDLFYTGSAPDMGALEWVIAAPNLQAYSQDSTIILAWTAIEEDLLYYQLDRATNAMFTENVDQTYVTTNTHTDDDIDTDIEYFYRVSGYVGYWTDYSNTVSVIIESLDLDEDSAMHLDYKIHQNYPNPFNPVTTLHYDLPEDALVNITIYDVMGRIVNNLVSSQQNAGYKSIQWNADNNAGQPISAGLYLYTIQAGEFRQTKKMVLLK
ncbi:MAG TPA: T9SS type A sorting domain-containing protein [Candidatus Marinimicrobia bacterium]|nr:T9SS type A sorting domain-containing protein [Candidatus Neomarinimicrobiota bacterium]